jgi:cystathionine beta-lyase/cystathionine gamma-synthase
MIFKLPRAMTTPPLPAAFAAHLLAQLPAILAPGATPDDWHTEATTYDLNRFRDEDDFVTRFVALVDALNTGAPRDPASLRAALADCGLPSDYARLGQPLSTVVELLLQAQHGVRRAITFASCTKPYLAIAEAYATPSRVVRIFSDAPLPLSDAKKRSLRAASVELHEGHRGEIPPARGGALTVHVRDHATPTPAAEGVDAVVIPVEGGGVTLLVSDVIAPKPLQLVRKRTAAALLAVDARDVLARAAAMPLSPRVEATHETCEGLLRGLFPEIRASAIFHTGLAAEAAVFSAAARRLDATRPVKLLYAENGYGGTCQLIAELLPRDGVVDPMPLPVLARDAHGNTVTLVERIIAALDALAGAPAVLFLETPTNPELQVHDFPRLFAALRAYEAKHGVQLPVLADTTLAPLFPLLAQPYAQGWPCVILKSGSKYFTKGKATLGVAFAGEHLTAQAIVADALAYGRDVDTLAKPTQRAALADGLRDLAPRMARIAENTVALSEGIRAALRRHGHEVLLYTIDRADIARGLASGVLSFYLPAAPTTHADLVDEFVDELLQKAPALVKSRVSYGQSTGGGRPDYFYVINPEESTQGALSADVKAAQKRDNVQICRISVPEHADVPGLLRAIEGFLQRKYG